MDGWIVGKYISTKNYITVTSLPSNTLR